MLYLQMQSYSEISEVRTWTCGFCGGDTIQSISNGLVWICLRGKTTLKIPIISMTGKLISLETGDLFSISDSSVATFSAF